MSCFSIVFEINPCSSSAIEYETSTWHSDIRIIIRFAHFALRGWRRENRNRIMVSDTLTELEYSLVITATTESGNPVPAWCSARDGAARAGW